MLGGNPTSCFAASMASVASPREELGARLKEMVTTGNCPWWLTDKGEVFISKCVNELRGTAAPFAEEVAAGRGEPALAAEEEAVALGEGPAEPPAEDVGTSGE